MSRVPGKVLKEHWAWVNSTDGTQRDGSASLTTARTSTGIFTVSKNDGTAIRKAKAWQFVNGDPTTVAPAFVECGKTSSTQITVRVLTSLIALQDVDFLIVIE